MSTLGGFHVDKFSTWREFKSDLYIKIENLRRLAMGGRIPAAPIDPKKFVFRGHSCSSWKLLSSFDRRFKELCATLGCDSDDIENYYRRRLEEFQKDCVIWGIDRDAPPKLDETVYIEQLGQHHGFPSRLLDWSQSPYVAAFFAFIDENSCTAGDVSIWALDCLELERCVKRHEVEILHNTFSKNERMRMQLGLFTNNKTNYMELEEYFRNSSKYSRPPRYPVLYRFDIPVTEAAEAISDLERMSIDYSRLFPGIEGLCRLHEYLIRRGVGITHP